MAKRDQFSTSGTDGLSFTPWFPTETKGDGAIRPNNLRPGKDQVNARPSERRKVRCKQCGFPADLSRHDNSGGDLSGQGAGGVVTNNDQAYRKGAGCPMCYSKNYSSVTSDVPKF